MTRCPFPPPSLLPSPFSLALFFVFCPFLLSFSRIMAIFLSDLCSSMCVCARRRLPQPRPRPGVHTRVQGPGVQGRSPVFGASPRLGPCSAASAPVPPWAALLFSQARISLRPVLFFPLLSLLFFLEAPKVPGLLSLPVPSLPRSPGRILRSFPLAFPGCWMGAGGGCRLLLRQERGPGRRRQRFRPSLPLSLPSQPMAPSRHAGAGLGKADPSANPTIFSGGAFGAGSAPAGTGSDPGSVSIPLRERGWAVLLALLGDSEISAFPI